MSLPSDMLDAIVSALRAKLPDAVTVEIIDRAFGVRDADFVTVPYPSVLVACVRVGAPDGNLDWSPPIVSGSYVAACISRFDEPAEGLSAGDAALNLAALVYAALVTERLDGRGYSLPSNMRIDPLAHRTLEGRDLTGWVVRWDQEFELTFPAAAGRKLSAIGILIPRGGADTPDLEAEYKAPGVSS